MLRCSPTGAFSTAHTGSSLRKQFDEPHQLLIGNLTLTEILDQLTSAASESATSLRRAGRRARLGAWALPAHALTSKAPIGRCLGRETFRRRRRWRFLFGRLVSGTACAGGGRSGPSQRGSATRRAREPKFRREGGCPRGWRRARRQRILY